MVEEKKVSGWHKAAVVIGLILAGAMVVAFVL